MSFHKPTHIPQLIYKVSPPPLPCHVSAAFTLELNYKFVTLCFFFASFQICDLLIDVIVAYVFIWFPLSTRGLCWWAIDVYFLSGFFVTKTCPRLGGDYLLKPNLFKVLLLLENVTNKWYCDNLSHHHVTNNKSQQIGNIRNKK